MQMRNQLKDSLKTPEEERYSGKITRHDHFDDLTDIDNALNKVHEHLAVEERRRYTESSFGHLLRMDRGMNFSASIVHRLLIRELHHDGPEDEMRFLLGRHSVRFSKVEFCLITGLKFGELPDTSTYDMVENGIHQRYFESRDEVEYVELKAILRIGVFSEQYDSVKLCLLYMLNWILMGLDEREKVPVWQFRLVEDLDAFDAFSWGAHVYRRSIYGFKHALDGRRRQFEQCQRRKGVDVHTTETYNIYGLTYALLIFAFEVIPELGNSGYGKRREIEFSPRILKWELSTRPKGEKLNSIFLESGGSLYDADVGDIPVPISDPERYTTARTSDTESPSFEPSDTEGSDSDGRHIHPVRTRRFDDPPFNDEDGYRDFSPRERTSSHQDDQQGPDVTPREKVTRGTSGTDIAPMEIEQELQQVLPDQPIHSQDLVHSTSLQHTPLVNPSAEHPFIHSTGTKIPTLSTPKELTPAGDRRRHSSYLQRTPTGDTEGQSPSTHRTSGGNTRGQSSSLQLTYPVDRTELDRIPPPLQRQDRVCKPGWQQRTPYTDPSRLKRPRIRTQPPHVWAPHALIDPDHLAAYQAYKRNSTGELRDMDLLESVGVPWFHRFQTNIMELEDTHMDAYLHILWKRQRYYSTVYGPRISILDSQFYSWLLNDWERWMGSGADKPCRSWSLFKHQWSADDLKVVLIPCNLGHTHWALASVDLTTGSIYLMDPFRQEMQHLRRYSSGTLMLGPSLTISGLEHLLLLCPDCPHLLYDYVVILSEDEACRPSIGRPDCLFDFGFKTTRDAMSDGTTYEEGWPTGIIGTDDYVLRTHETTIMLLKSMCNDFSDYDCTSLSVATVNLLQRTTVLVDKTSDLEVSPFISPHRS
ncbi:hypothetical protein LWI28_010355 [Acer negundo]|uniref:Ubiquitin-like protease family profile domain-containing protein n=1 Tax=Acer negundo TaxID=4023 RepID=A0AAD5II99_ACENE|nr:hypothetical protein LWI28_010355 [Acer negundo]